MARDRDLENGTRASRSYRHAHLLRMLPLFAVIGVLALAYVEGWQELLTLDEVARRRMALQQAVADHRALTIGTFILLYIVCVAVSLPVSAALTITGGFLFGWLGGAAAALVGATAGATLIFLIARSAFGESLRGRMAGRFDTLASGFEESAFTYLLALRLAPVFPFFVINIVPALFRVRVIDYVGATFLGIIPGALAYSWLGRGLDSVIESAAESGGLRPADLVTREILLAFVALGIVAFIPAVVKRLRGGRLTGASRPQSGEQ